MLFSKHQLFLFRINPSHFLVSTGVPFHTKHFRLSRTPLLSRLTVSSFHIALCSAICTGSCLHSLPEPLLQSPRPPFPAHKETFTRDSHFTHNCLSLLQDTEEDYHVWVESHVCSPSPC